MIDFFKEYNVFTQFYSNNRKHGQNIKYLAFKIIINTISPAAFIFVKCQNPVMEDLKN